MIEIEMGRGKNLLILRDSQFIPTVLSSFQLQTYIETTSKKQKTNSKSTASFSSTAGLFLLLALYSHRRDAVTRVTITIDEKGKRMTSVPAAVYRPEIQLKWQVTVIRYYDVIKTNTTSISRNNFHLRKWAERKNDSVSSDKYGEIHSQIIWTENMLINWREQPTKILFCGSLPIRVEHMITGSFSWFWLRPTHSRITAPAFTQLMIKEN